ncbi:MULTISPECIES: flagellar hook-basal body complex protein [Thalassospira]|jgi:flagellar basal-body rod protein FlgF|uniref:Flagellar basal-body rod protein FlgF n=1 Tax=Thalassospira profundimaris TaxID=502049 RepID=A0A367VAI2_9PROT|nr:MULTISPECIES: flagellar hook-basal body complex protein [Thalassospira]MBC45980.1 flagellar biosynthesis protein FlgF [Thalassospira sp.]MBR9902186.1 flagellar hook-basal body complex protein [Rhodospirillales bacterium]KZB72187.1 flagellar biosynthesis protein FlgF [Thalassospira sp. MCCC 1A01148]MBS8274663.1 flagellar hook-basal body complex protein [Thalassospira tepidiphila]RCK21382.1 flagellar basal-body rod protein FlgF [Thalassospira profundimaris]|tara:strand:+ start:1578 stop:2336 length:759 start_codon:yes stop_codon:yes gene_type:complete
MENVSYIALSRQKTLRSMMSNLSQNMANMNTTGYKEQRMMFTDWIAKNKDAPFRGEREISLVQDISQYRNTTVGTIEHTDRPLDVALSQPDMFFAVETPTGVQYTRSGNFSLDPGGQLITNDGFPVLSDAGQPMFFNEADGQIEIKGDGTIATDIGQIGKLQVVTVDNVQEMTVTGNTLYQAPEGEDNQDLVELVENPGIVQGALEKSNVNPIGAMTQMIDVLRTYQSVTRSLESENERMRNMINKLGDVRA